ncbi:MAG: hypothetical protein LBR65_02405 [Culturomica sp.]|nr:hypothetical protein [Culturomica sp.]
MTCLIQPDKKVFKRTVGYLTKRRDIEMNEKEITLRK